MVTVDTATCSQTLLQKPFAISIQCMLLLLSKVLGVGVSVAGLFYKIPVIVKILKAKDAEGLSLFALYLEAVAYMSRVVYNILKGHPLTTYGDYCFVMCQQFIIILLAWWYGMGGAHQSTAHITQALSVGILLLGSMLALPAEQHYAIALCGLIISLFSKLPQIYSNFQYRKVGVQSLTTLWNGSITSAVKVYVVAVDTGDQIMVTSCVISLVMNTTMLCQVLSYRSSDVVPSKVFVDRSIPPPPAVAAAIDVSESGMESTSTASFPGAKSGRTPVDSICGITSVSGAGGTRRRRSKKRGT